LAWSCSGFVAVFDYFAEGFPGGGEVVFEVADAALSLVCFSCPGVTFGGECAGEGFEVGDSGDERGRVGAVEFGAELEAESVAEFAVLGSQPADLFAGQG
jgi:hypothetical protein